MAERPEAWRDGIDAVAIGGDTGYKTAASEAISDAIPVMAPFHVVRLLGDALDKTRQRAQQETVGPRGRKGAPLHGCLRLLRTGPGPLEQHHLAALEHMFDSHPDHLVVEVTWDTYQRAVGAYRHQGQARRTKISST